LKNRQALQETKNGKKSIKRMLAIMRMPQFGFGNKLLYYFNLRKAARESNQKYHCDVFDGMDLFGDKLTGDPPVENFSDFALCLGEKFFSGDFLDSREIFRLNGEREAEERVGAVHFRGTDFFTWNPESILETTYYISAIEEVFEEVDSFQLFTDDAELESFRAVKTYLDERKKVYSLGQNTSNRSEFKKDFVNLANCDLIISSPSTFCISAGFVGKRKKIIHSEKWILSRIQKSDLFWVGLNEGGNENYKLWKTF
jgi:hypothetical protein